MTDEDERTAPVLKAAARPKLLPESDWSATMTILVAAAMAFLGVLALAAGMAAVRMAAEWRADLAGVATVRVSAVPEAAISDRLTAIVEVLRTTPGIARVRVLSDAEQSALLEPWLGEGASLADLPAPRLIDVTLDGGGPDAEALQERLDLTVSGAVYDDHAAWRKPLADSADALTRLAFGATALVLVTAGAMIAYAARATLAANVRVIEVVRLIGAEDRFISSAFVRRLAWRAALGGFIGALVACGALALMPAVEADAALAVALRPEGPGWALLAIGLPAAGTAVSWVAARVAVGLALARMP